MVEPGGGESPRTPTPFGQLQGLLERVSGISAALDSRGIYQGPRRIDASITRSIGDEVFPFTFKGMQVAIVDQWSDQIEVTMSTPDADAARFLGTQPYTKLVTMVFSEKPPIVRLEINAAASMRGHFVLLLGLRESLWSQNPKNRSSWSTNAETEAVRLVNILTVAATPTARTRG